MDLIYLVSYAVNELKPSPERCAEMDLESVLSLAKLHMLSAAAAVALEKTVSLPTSWRDAKGTAIRRMIIFNSERTKVLRAFDENGIWYAPLKGAVLKNYYPKAEMREMADNDILCDGTKMVQLRKIMQALGFECASFGRTNHDVYRKNKMNFEMHRTLFRPYAFPLFDSYYADVKERLIKDDDTLSGYHMSDEDFYIYILCHMFQHYDSAGIGLRALLDIYVINQKKGRSLNREYIGRELKRLDLKAFESEVRILAEKTFSLQPLSEEEQEQLAFFFKSNCFGLISIFLAKRISKINSKSAKRRYIFRRFFPEANFIRIFYPRVYQYKILYPFFCVYRIFYGLIKHRKKLLLEYQMLKQCQFNKLSGCSNNSET